MVLAATENAAGWVVGFALGGVVVLVVAVLVITLIASAARIKKQAHEAGEALEQVRESTGPLWAVDQVNTAAVGILAAARKARGALGGG